MKERWDAIAEGMMNLQSRYDEIGVILPPLHDQVEVMAEHQNDQDERVHSFAEQVETFDERVDRLYG